MFVRKLKIEWVDESEVRQPCPLKWIDNFAMRNFTNDAIFDDTLPVADGLLEAGHRVPLDRLRTAMEDWFRRKGYIGVGERVEVAEQETGSREKGSGSGIRNLAESCSNDEAKNDKN